MKNCLRKLTLAMLSLFLLSAPAMAQSRIGTVDLKKIFDNYWKKKEAEANLKEREADLVKEDKAMIDEYKKAKEEYQGSIADANNQALSTDERDKRKKVAEDKLKKLKLMEENIGEFEKTAKTRLGEQSQRMRSSIITEIRNAVSAKAKAAGYSLVIDTASESANLTPVILYSNNESDLTDAVLSQLNAGARVDGALSEEKKEDKKDEKKKGDKSK
jgi:outer membrane protein